MTDISLDEIKKLVGMQLGRRHMNATDRFAEDLGAESADVANLVATAEEKYGVTIKESEIARIFTAEDLYVLIQKQIQ